MMRILIDDVARGLLIDFEETSAMLRHRATFPTMPENRAERIRSPIFVVHTR